MTGCAALGCKNRAMKGTRSLRAFPRDPKRRKLWASKVKRPYWFPTDHSFLCDDHFDKTQFETIQVDGKKRLKWNAVPNIFAHSIGSRKAAKEEPNIVIKEEKSLVVASTSTRKSVGSGTSREMSLRSCAFGCELVKGTQLYNIPTGDRNEERRKSWLIRIRRKLDNNTAYLCELHFEESQFVPNSLGGLKKLKRDAIPTIFSRQGPKTFKRKASPDNEDIEDKRKLKAARRKTKILIEDPTHSEKSPPTRKTSRAKRKKVPVNSAKEVVPCKTPVGNIEKENQVAIPEKISEDSNEGLDPKDIKIKFLQQRVWILQQQSEQVRRALRKIFLPDQLQQLAAPSLMGIKWTVATIKECLILRFVIGDKGYEYLHKKGHPIPSKETLLRRMKDVNLKEVRTRSMKIQASDYSDLHVEPSGTDTTQDNDETVTPDNIFTKDGEETVETPQTTEPAQDRVVLPVVSVPAQTVLQNNINHVKNNKDSDDNYELGTIDSSDNPDSDEGVNSSDSDEDNADKGENMEWEIFIEQDLASSEVDDAQKSASAWQIALAALHMSADKPSLQKAVF